ncbi:MAG TPA: hypothetical protein EYP60_08660 [bacterium (Candidatus Stahlbacteria)]|nr:hypothetical protein [Candidatus Stahlbacteria bacterium]
MRYKVKKLVGRVLTEKRSLYLRAPTLIILCFISSGCKINETEQDWQVNVQFCDSTFHKIEEPYKIGEIIYVLASEYFEAEMPDTVEIVIESGIGDYEIIKASLQGVIPIPEIRDHGGHIHSYATESLTQKNGIIEVHLYGDTLWAAYTVKGSKAVDTAYIILDKERRQK